MIEKSLLPLVCRSTFLIAMVENDLSFCLFAKNKSQDFTFFSLISVKELLIEERGNHDKLIKPFVSAEFLYTFWVDR